ncbi:ATP-dependent helicase HrpB [Salinarimonas rosea]|uniref:ATP-dependent helicase HrpB n=1 Tax=Salinarimonas rosea TaxID=552063 RepID=UPI00040649C0|nr:ATP-dependent helicase HrpB [Salinarimonas rosea]
MRAFDTPLPIDAVLADLAAALRAGPRAVLVAPPGAGKTTRVPLALLDEPWARGGKLVLLEPRRLAARAAAERMARTLGERVGETVGLRVRLGTQVSAKTRIEVVTEGVFTRMILDDPTLDGIAAVLFDEYHERSLDADLGLALALDAQGALREDLRLLVMSATLDGARVAALLEGAPVVESEGRAFPVETRHVGRDPRARIEEAVGAVVMRALAEETGSLLVFLPGQAEIRRTARLLEERVRDPAVEIAPLYGALDRAEQDHAVSPAAPGRRKVVLATSIAETSLTIEGVRVVIDSGLSRVPVYEPAVGLTRLATVRVSRASADQRRGRAGRTGPGVCWRLWEEAATGALQPFSTPEILAADLASLVLDCAAWGVTDPGTLPFLDAPPRPALAEARALLGEIGALDADGRITPLGARVRALPLPPRLAAMVLRAAERGEAARSAEIAALLVERGLGGEDVDLAHRLDRVARERGGRAQDMRRLARGWAAQATEGLAPGAPEGLSVGALVALAYPDRIARARGKPGDVVLANGRGAALEPHLALAREPFLAIAEIAGSAGAARVLAAAALAPEEIEALFPDRIVSRDEIAFDAKAKAVRGRAVRRIGSVVLSERPIPLADDPQTPVVLARGIAKLGIDMLPWSKAATQLRRRIAFLRAAEGAPWPDVSDEALAETIEAWLAPMLAGRTALAQVEGADVLEGLRTLLPWDLQRRLDAEAPTHWRAPTGTSVAVDYDRAEPAIAIRVQELYGLATHPALAGGRRPLVLELLSPAHRPIQVTKDLPGFWRGSWAEVRAEMRGRYPRHVWPEDPAAAAPTTRAKPRGT